MFGNAPRAMWSRWSEPDELGRVGLSCRCFLVNTGSHKILVETGIGAFFEPSLRERFGVVEPYHVLLESLAATGTSQDDIDVVVLSHLHFDHAGGLLAAWQSGKDPSLLFPRARYVVGAVALERAKHPHVRDRASFITALPGLLEDSGRLEVVASGQTWSEALGERFELMQSDGHTPGMLHVVLRGKNASAVFCADMIPGTAWVHAPITMGYDRHPERLVDEKLAAYRRWERDGTWLLFTHDESVATSQVARDARGRYAPVNPVATLAPGWDLDAHAAPATA